MHFFSYVELDDLKIEFWKEKDSLIAFINRRGDYEKETLCPLLSSNCSLHGESEGHRQKHGKENGSYDRSKTSID